MPYVIDRQRALRLYDVVMVLQMRQRRIRSRIVLNDNSLYQTLTRPRTMLRIVGEGAARWPGAAWTNRSRGISWRKR